MQDQLESGVQSEGYSIANAQPLNDAMVFAMFVSWRYDYAIKDKKQT